MTAPVFFLDDAAARSLAVGTSYRLGGSEGRHAAAVLRLAPGEQLDLVDGAGLRASTEVTANDSDSVLVSVLAVEREPSPQPRLTLVQALAKDHRDLQAIEAAVECGVDAVIPWAADRSIVQWRGPKQAKGQQKWADTVRAATKQSRRAWLPDVGDVLTSKQLTARIADVVATGGAALVLHESAEVGLAEVDKGPPNVILHEPHRGEAAGSSSGPRAVAAVGKPVAPALLVIVGPEGGISDAELAAFTAAGAQAVRLGPHIMRTSTAGPVAVAMLAARLGRWDHPGTVPSGPSDAPKSPEAT